MGIVNRTCGSRSNRPPNHGCGAISLRVNGNRLRSGGLYETVPYAFPYNDLFGRLRGATSVAMTVGAVGADRDPTPSFRRPWPGRGSALEPWLAQADEAGACESEPTGVLIERGQIGCVVDKKPFASGGACFRDGMQHDSSAEALMLMGWMRLGVNEERVIGAVPRDIDETHELMIGCSRCDPAEGMRADPIPPSSFG